jgi:hypothetical protein
VEEMTPVHNNQKKQQHRRKRRSVLLLLLSILLFTLLVVVPLIKESIHLTNTYLPESKDAHAVTKDTSKILLEQSRECSCYNPNADHQCCERLLLTGHKFGYMKTVRTFQGWITQNAKDVEIVSNLQRWGQIRNGKNRTKIKNFLPRHQDFRHVWITRNWFHALVSGYLYHKEGKECWLDPDGNDDFDASYWRNFSWMKGWRRHITLPYPAPASNDTSFCQYLNDVPTEDGMKVMIEWSLRYFYGVIVPYLKSVKASQYHRVLHLCYSDYTQNAVADIMDHLFPGAGYGNNVAAQPQLARMKVGHSTSKNVTLRDELLELVHRLDGEYFDNEIARSDAMLGCKN